MVSAIRIQDRDLLSRLNSYLEGLDSYLREGIGWLIFNADRQRTARIVNFMVDILKCRQPPVGFTLMPWRDFAMNAYMLKIELAHQPRQAEGGDPKVAHEYRIATHVSLELYRQMVEQSLIIITGLVPRHSHEAVHLDEILDHRVQHRQATVIITPRMPDQLAADFEAIDPSKRLWQRIFSRLYETTLIAF
jgi:hypothetical protein